MSALACALNRACACVHARFFAIRAFTFFDLIFCINFITVFFLLYTVAIITCIVIINVTCHICAIISLALHDYYHHYRND